MKSIELRKKFFDFFVARGHEKIASSSLIPADDPTLLFANAGMNQFKDVFLGNEKRSYTRAVSIQKCVRAGGKHNDLENVGFTQRHLTFFEMMGNFSFGDYFKKEAIAYAWDFLTKEVGLDIKDLYVTVHHSDQESYDIWHNEMGISKERIFKLGESNFWQMGDVGPCGPCTEIFVDRGPSVGCGSTICSPDCGCDRFLEVWNNVFMQFSRQADGTDVLLKQTGVDTGMGLERLALVVQKKDSVFQTDAFQVVFTKIEELTGYSYQDGSDDIRAAFNVLGDHVRSSTFLIGDGCAPANDGRGYVLRKIIRRAALFAQKLTEENIFPQLSIALINDIQLIYPELMAQKERIAAVLQSEIERFSDNLTRGKRILQDHMSKSDKLKIITGDYAFMLHDTYGFPLEVTKIIALEHSFTVDELGFEKSMEVQRQRSGKKMKEVGTQLAFIDEGITTEFTGYSSLKEVSKVRAIVADDASVEVVAAGTMCWIVAEKTPFYVACGGQINDAGTIVVAGGSAPLLDLKKSGDGILMQIVAPKTIVLGDEITMVVDNNIRMATMKNHTATHLLQAALQGVLGSGVRQAGSVVTPDYLRFDFTYHKPMTAQEIKAVENLINEKIWENIEVVTENTTYKSAVARGVTAFFGDKYNQENVRAVHVRDFSAELCGGTHVRATGDIGSFKIIEEISLAAGQRRIVGVTGPKALEEFQQDFYIIKNMCQSLKIKPGQALDAVDGLNKKIQDLQKQIKLLQGLDIKNKVPAWLVGVEKIEKMPFLFLNIVGYDVESMRDIAQQLQKISPGFYFIMQSDDSERVTFLATVDVSFSDKISMATFKLWLKDSYRLQGGGNALILQGGGAQVDLKKCQKDIKIWLQSNI